MINVCIHELDFQEDTMRLSTKSLSMLKESSEIVDIYRDHLSAENLVGIITDFNDNFIYMSLIDDSGKANGISVFYRNDVTRIRWGGNERNSYKSLMQAATSKLATPPLDISSIDLVIRSVSDIYGYVNILTERMESSITFIGEVEDMDIESIILKTYGTFSSRDRSQLLIKIDEITRVDADAQYERSVKFLASSR